MITNHSLKQIGYSNNETSGILQKLNRLNVPKHKTKIRHDYIRNGVICNVEMVVHGFLLEDTIVALNSYYQAQTDIKVRNRWESVLNQLIEYKSGIVN